MAPRVSLCLIVKNAEASLPACLASTADLVDEILLVDTGSTDRTKEIAAAFQARIVDFAWVDSFAAARNEGLGHARGDWIFYLDADEYLDEANRQKLRALLRGLGDETIGYVMTVWSRLAQKRGLRVGFHRVCLFRQRPEHRWKYRVHEQIRPALQATGTSIRWTDIGVEHSGYEDATLARRKLERNLHLLQLDLGDQPKDPFVLLYLGWTYLGLGRVADALPLLRRSHELAPPTFTLLPLLVALQVDCLQHLGRREEAFAVCEAGRGRFPADATLLFKEALLRQRQGDPRGAETCLGQLLRIHPEADRLPPPLRSIPTDPGAFVPTLEGLRGYLARHHLALLWFEEGRLPEAEAAWWAVLTEQPDFAPAAIHLGELFLAQERWTELEQTVARLESGGSASLEAALLRARACLGRQAFPEACQILEATIACHPNEVWPRVFLTHAFLQQGQEEAAEQALRDVLRRDPSQVECWRNLAKLLRNQHRPAEAATVCDEGRRHFADEPDLLRIHGWALQELQQRVAMETCLRTTAETTALGDRPDERSP